MVKLMKEVIVEVIVRDVEMRDDGVDMTCQSPHGQNTGKSS
jgi:hypothetical protein